MPTRVYRYGLLPPTTGAEIIAEQISRAHRYYNTLVEIERRRREAVAELLTTGPLADTAAAVSEAEAHMARVRDRIALQKAEQRTRKTDPALKAEADAARAALHAARAAHRAARVAAKEDPALAAGLVAITARAKAEHKAARASCGVYWGTYLRIEQAMDAARSSPTPPAYRRWTGDGAVSVQIQGGMPVTALSTSDTRLQLDPRPQPVPGRRGQPRPRVRLRIGSTGDRKPIWGEWPVILHRPLPPEGIIKTATVVRQRLAGRDVWSLHLTLTLPDVERAPELGRGLVAVDLGWHRDPDGLVAGIVMDEASAMETITVPARAVAALRKADEIRSIRDRNLNEIQAQLVAWRKDVEVLADAHREALERLPAWRSPARFARLALWWRDHRHEGDEAILQALEAWRQRDRHLWLYETHARRGAIAHRRDVYRQVAARLATRYDTLVVERLDLRRLAEAPPPESEREVARPPAGRQRVMSAPSELRSALLQAFAARGGRVVLVPAGPAPTLLAAARERSGDAPEPDGAREGRAARFRRIKQAARAGSGSASEALAL